MFKTILVPLDRSRLAEQALDIAAEIARASDAPLDLVLVHERPLGMHADDPFDVKQREEEDRYLESIVAEIKSQHNLTARHAVLVGKPAEMIAARAHDVGADLIVLTSHGRTGWNRVWLGSVADGVMRESNRPVLMLRVAPGEAPRGNVRPVLRRILVPLDGSPVAASMLAHANRLAHCLQGRITLLRVVQPATIQVPAMGADAMAAVSIEDPEATKRAVDIATRELEENAAFLVEQGCGGVEHRLLVSPDAADAIVDFVRTSGTDLVAMSTHGRGMSRLLIGSVADKVLRSTSAALLLRRPTEALPNRVTPRARHLSKAS